LSLTLLILKINTPFEDVQIMQKWFFDFSTGFRFSKISVECSVHLCSCPWINPRVDYSVNYLLPTYKNTLDLAPLCDVTRAGNPFMWSVSRKTKDWKVLQSHRLRKLGQDWQSKLRKELQISSFIGNHPPALIVVFWPFLAIFLKRVWTSIGSKDMTQNANEVVTTRRRSSHILSL
jgi:hypothetical protein